MPLDRTIYGINHGKPFVMKADESYTFRNESERTLYATMKIADGGRVAVEIGPTRTLEIATGSGVIEVELIALRPGY